MRQKLITLFQNHDPTAVQTLDGDHRVVMPDGSYSLPRPLKAAAVLIPVIDRPLGMTILLTKRADHLKNHSGQVSFPGGRVEPEDRDMTATALRETTEEVGIAPSDVTILGRMADYATATGYRITPVVGLITPPFAMTIDRNEVAEVFELPLADILDERNYQLQSRVWQNQERHYYVLPYKHHKVWGATAALLVRLAQLMKDRLS